MTIVEQAIQNAMNNVTFSKFLSANDTGLTGGHQAGVYISKPSVPLLFDEPGIKGENKEKWVTIEWQDSFQTRSRFIYYGRGTRDEYRITNFGRDFPYLRPEYTGALLIIIKINEEYYKAYCLNTEDEINSFLDSFGLTPAETNRLIEMEKVDVSLKEQVAINKFIAGLKEEFPSSEIMSSAAREIALTSLMNEKLIITNPDKAIIQWTDQEYRLFRALEHARYGNTVAKGFTTVDDFVAYANKVLNRRKSRAGKSLEHHLEAIFQSNQIQFTAQAVTEGNKKPDFIFPSQEAYHDYSFPVDKLASLAAKTTCKDRWRQILNEADRLRDGRKYLCTLQQGISSQQMDEMEAEGVTLVVPKVYISTYPKDKQNRIWTLHKFIDYIKELQDE